MLREIVCRWLKRARDDLVVAESELGRITWASVFHSQQAAEKALKALLTAIGKQPPKTHDLKVLINILKNNVDTGFLEGRRVGELTKYAVEARYPDFEEEPGEEEAGEALNLAKTVLKWATERLEELGIKCYDHQSSKEDNR